MIQSTVMRRLQAPDELGPDFTLDENGSDSYRAAFEQEHPNQVRELREAEEKRRQKKAGQQKQNEDDQLKLVAEA